MTKVEIGWQRETHIKKTQKTKMTPNFEDMKVLF